MGQACSKPTQEDIQELYVAAGAGDLNYVSVLLGRRSYCNSVKSAALITATGQGHVHVAKLLLSWGADVNSRVHSLFSLLVASANGHVDVVRTLISNGADWDSVSTRDGDTSLLKAACNGHSTIVRLLLGFRADTHVRNYFVQTALTVSSGNGFLDIVRMILCARGKEPWLKGDRGGDALLAMQAAAGRNHTDVMRVLLEAGAASCVTEDDGSDLLIWAACAREVDCLKQMIAQGVDARLVASHGPYATPLIAAAYHGHIDVVEALVEHGVDLTVEDGDHCTALTYAIKNGHRDVVQLLEARMAALTPPPVFHGAREGSMSVTSFCGKSNGVGSTMRCASYVCNPDVSFHNTPPHADTAGALATGRTPQHSVNVITRREGAAPGSRISGGGNNVGPDGGGSGGVFSGNNNNHARSTTFENNTTAAGNGTFTHHGSSSSTVDTNNSSSIKSSNDGDDQEEKVERATTHLLDALSRADITSAIDLISNHGADANARDRKGFTPLLHPPVYTSIELVSALLKHGADVRVRGPRGHTSLMSAAEGTAEMDGEVVRAVVALLVEHGADVAWQDSRGNTALMFAAVYDNAAFVTSLLAHNAAINVKNGQGHTASHLAVCSGHEKLAQELNAEANAAALAAEESKAQEDAQKRRDKMRRKKERKRRGKAGTDHAWGAQELGTEAQQDQGEGREVQRNGDMVQVPESLQPVEPQLGIATEAHQHHRQQHAMDTQHHAVVHEEEAGPQQQRPQGEATIEVEQQQQQQQGPKHEKSSIVHAGPPHERDAQEEHRQGSEGSDEGGVCGQAADGADKGEGVPDSDSGGKGKGAHNEIMVELTWEDLLDAPPVIECPISSMVMRDPVVAADGHSFDRQSIEEWIAKAAEDGVPLRSPMTNQPMEPTLYRNLSLRSVIDEYLEKKTKEKRKRLQASFKG